MHSVKLGGCLAALAVVAISAASPVVASAANPAFLGGTVLGLKFKGESGKTELVSVPPNLVCTKDLVTGEVTGEKTLKATIDLEGCTEAGLADNSLGDAKGVVLIPVSGELCYINEMAKEVGVYFKIANPGVHVEIPAVGELDLYEGQFIGKVQSVNISQALQDISIPKPAITACGPKGEKTAKLLIFIDEAAKPETATLTSFEELHFEKAIEIMA